MATPSYQLPCLKNDNIAQGIYDFRFTRPKDFAFEAGQFVLFDVPAANDDTDIQTRAFSIASSPQEDELIFVAKLIEGGRASAWIEHVLTENTMVRMQGPFGRFTLQHANPKEYLFVCTSTGIAPFRSQILTALQQGETRRIDLLFGARTEEDLFWQEECNGWAQSYDNFTIHYALSQPSSDWKGHRGRVQTLCPHIAQNIQSKQIYVCCNPAMTTDVKKLCLEEWGVQKEDLHVEGYI